MATFSNLKFVLITTGDEAGTWGATTNTNLGTAIEEAIVASADVSFVSADVTLTLQNLNPATTQAARNFRLNLTGTSGGARNLYLGSGCQIEKPYLIKNGLADAVTVVNYIGGSASGTSVVVPAGKSTWVFNTGADIVAATDYAPSLTLGTALTVGSGGTGATTSTGSGSVVLSNSPTLVTPALGTPASGNFSTGTFTWPTFNQNTTGQAGKAVNITGGTTGSVPYQSATDTTAFLSVGAAGTVMVVNPGGTAPSWVAQSSLSVGSAGSATNVSNAVTFNNGGSGAASGTTFNGSTAQTISYNTLGASPLAGSTSLTTLGTVTTGTWNASQIANSYLVNSSITINGTPISLGGSVSVAPAAGSTSITTLGTVTTGTWNASQIANSYLVNSSITINGNSVSLGGSTTVTASSPNALTIGTGLSGTSYNGSAAVTVAIDSTVATLTDTQTLTNKSISGASNTLTNIPNSALTNSSINLGSTSAALGSMINSFSMSGEISGGALSVSGSTVATNGMYRFAADILGFSTNSIAHAVLWDYAFDFGLSALDNNRFMRLNNPGSTANAYATYYVQSDVAYAAISALSSNYNSTTYRSKTLFCGKGTGATGTIIADFSTGTNQILFWVGTSASPITTATVNSAGIWTYPNKPAFFTYLSTTQSNVIGTTATTYTVPFDTELFDRTNNVSAGVFTAPVTGIYRFSMQAVISDLGSGAFATQSTALLGRLVTTSQTYAFGYLTPEGPTGGTNYFGSFVTVSGSIAVSMTAGDTAYITLQAAGGVSDTADLRGNTSGGYYTWFSGELVA